MRTIGELVWHISHGRMDWFRRLGDHSSIELFEQMARADVSADLVSWLSRTWAAIADILDRWTVEDLSKTFEHEYNGKIFAVSRQWVIWRIMAHDIHHGGQVSELLGAQGIFPLELTWLGGHLTEPPVLRDAPSTI